MRGGRTVQTACRTDCTRTVYVRRACACVSSARRNERTASCSRAPGIRTASLLQPHYHNTARTSRRVQLPSHHHHHHHLLGPFYGAIAVPSVTRCRRRRRCCCCGHRFYIAASPGVATVARHLRCTPPPL